MSGTIPTTNVSFSNLVSTYNNINDPDLSTTNIALSNFRNKEFSSGSAVPNSGAISIGTNFKGRTWKAPGPTGWIAVTTSTSVNGSSRPGIVNAYWRRHVIKFTYSANLMSAAGITSGSVIKKLRIYVTNGVSSSYQPFPSYSISLKNSTSNASSNPGTSGWSQVKGNHNFYATGNNRWYEFDISDFAYTGNTLCFSFSWGQIPGGYTSDGQSYIFSDSGDAYAWFDKTDNSGTFSSSSTANRQDAASGVTMNNTVPRVDMFF